jgi:hypothetical protein
MTIGITAKKNQVMVLVFHGRKMSKMRSITRNDKDQQQEEEDL